MDIVKEIKRMSRELKGNVIISLDATLSIQVINNFLSFSFSVRSMTIKTAKIKCGFQSSLLKMIFQRKRREHYWKYFPILVK